MLHIDQLELISKTNHHLDLLNSVYFLHTLEILSFASCIVRSNIEHIFSVGANNKENFNLKIS
jgi:hypothetical protein